MERAEFDIADMLPIGITFVVLIIGLAIGLQVVGSVGSSMTANSAEKNATTEGITALQVLTSNLDTVALVVIAALIIGILVRYMMGR